MGSDKRILIACRYVPHDQWFLTNISPSWKIKHLKQSIIAKALNLPFDRRFLIEDPTARPPSPITFAPVEGPLQESGFSSGPGSGVDKTQTDYRMRGRDDGGNLTNDFGVAGTISDVPIVEPSFVEYKSQIYSSVFTLIRFSTGQILEEHFFVSWYNLGPHELVELHCSSPPTTFARALVFGHMLMNGGSITVDIPMPTQKSSNPDRQASSSFAPSAVATLSLTLAEPLRLIRLPRHDLASYTEPYWEGWVRVLRVMWESNLDRSPTSLAEAFPQANGLNDTRTKTKEWRERWAVIRDGVLSLCKNRDDPTCTRLPLSALFSLCGADYFSSGHSDNDILPTNLPGGGPGGGNYKRPTSSQSNLTPTIRASRTASISDPSRVTTPIEDLGAWKYMSTATSNSATAPRVLSPLMTQSNQTLTGANKNPQVLATPIDASFSDYSHNTLLSVDPERSRRERAAVREWESERMQKELAENTRCDKQVEYTRWDDLVGFGGKSKAKNKEKEKEKDNEKGSNRIGKVREEKEQKTRKNTATVLARHVLIGEGGGSQKDKDCNQDRQQEKLPHHQGRLFHPDDRYIPASREEAVASGMLIVCAKFRIGVLEPMSKARNKDENCALNLLRDIGLDSSVASNRGDESGSTQGDRVERKAVWQQSQDLESSPIIKSLPPSRKASLPGLGHSLTMLTSGGHTTPVGSVFGGFFGNKDRANNNLEENDKQDPYSEIEGKQHDLGDHIRSPPTRSTILRKLSDDYHSPGMDGRLNLSIDSETLEKEPDVCPALPSPNYANDRRFDEGQDDRGGYHRAGHEPDDKQGNKEQKRRRRNEDKVELVVMDLGTETAYNSFLRILYRHSPLPTQSSLITSPFHPLSSNSSHDAVPEYHSVLPYPEWRRDIVFRARSQGMRELGRPLELSFTLYKLETQADQARKSRNEHGDQNSNRRRETMSENDHGSNNDRDEFEHLMLDDSDDGSEDESVRWWQDIPRQFSSEGNHFEWSTTRHRHSWSGVEENAEEYSPLSPNMPFTDPFTFSPSHADFSESILSLPGLGLDMEERLRPSISSSTLASNPTMSSMSSRSMTFGASSSNLKSSIRSVISKEEMGADNPTGISLQNSPGSYQSRSYRRRRIVSPSQTLSSPSSNESLVSNPYYHLPPRPFSPSSDIYLSNAYGQLASGHPSVLHHSASMPNASTWRSMPYAGSGIQTDMIREQTVIAPTVPLILEKPILSAEKNRRIEVDPDVRLAPITSDDPLPYDDFPANIDVLDRPILTRAQIQQIETETEARIGGDSTYLTPIASFGITDSTTKQKMTTPLFNESSPSFEPTFRQGQLAKSRNGKTEEDAGLERDSQFELSREAMSLEDFEGEDGSQGRNLTRRFMLAGVTRTHPTSPYSYQLQDYIGSVPPRSVSDSASISAEAILRRVRSGSSLQTPMGVHIEEAEEDGGARI